MDMVRKFIFMLISVMVLALNFSSCEIGKETSSKNNIRGDIVFSSNRTDFQTTLFKSYEDEFRRKYPNVDIEIETIKDYTESMKLKMSANNLPDVWTVHDGSYTRAALQRYNVALDKFKITKDFLFLDPFKGSDGMIYALPTGAVYAGVIYNKKIFNELSIKVPEKFDDLVYVAKKIKKAGYVPIATAAKAKWTMDTFWIDLPIMISGDNEIRNKMAAEKRPFIKGNAVYESYMILKRLNEEKLFENDPLAADWEPMKKEFRDGKVGMFILKNWFVPQAAGSKLKVADIGFFPFPYDNFSESKNTVAGPDVALAIAKSSKNILLAEEWFKFMMDDKYENYAKSCGLLSARKSIKIDSSIADEYLSFEPKILTSVGDSLELDNVVKKVQFDYNALAQDVLIDKNVEVLFNDINNKWEKAVN